MKICYVPKRFRPAAQLVIEQANEIIEDLQGQGYTLSLRQLYYQFVSKDLIPNTEKEYNKLKKTISDARMAGELPWDAIEDRTRSLQSNPAWSDPTQYMHDARSWYHTSWWKYQDVYLETWVEKDALVGVVGPACNTFDVPYFSCRGYTSASELWGAGERISAQVAEGKEVVVLHLGDHDSSGIDMSRDIRERLHLFVGCNFMEDRYSINEALPEPDDHESWAAWVGGKIQVKRIALSRAQVRQYNCPPNPAKMTDPRAEAYVKIHGDKSWELDALPVQVIDGLIRSHIEDHLNVPEFERAQAEEEAGKGRLTAVWKAMHEEDR